MPTEPKSGDMGSALRTFARFVSCSEVDRSEHSSQPRDVYEVGEELGIGAMGRVVKVISKKRSKKSVPVCAKIIDIEEAVRTGSAVKHGLTEEEILKMLADEVRSLKKVRGCAYTITFVECFNMESERWIVTELCTVGNIVEVLRRIRLDEHDQVAVLFSVLQAAKYIHKLDLVHSDIKLDNLVVDETGFIKLCDFGGACDCNSEGFASNRFPGTLPYTPPEILSGYVPEHYSYYAAPRFHQKRDVWSIGVLVLKLEDGESQLDYVVDLSGAHGLFTAVSFGYDVRTLSSEDYLTFLVPSSVSDERNSFMKAALVVELGERPTVSNLLEHPLVRQTESEKHRSQVLDMIRRFHEAPEPKEQSGDRFSDIFVPFNA